MDLELLGATSDLRDSKKKKLKTTVAQTNLDLEAYAANYTGEARRVGPGFSDLNASLNAFRPRKLTNIVAEYTRIERLLFIADHCPPLQAEAYKLALDALKHTLNFAKYTTVLSKLNEALTAKYSPAVAADTQWIENAQRTARSQTEKLETDLKTYKNNLIKESIRVGSGTGRLSMVQSLHGPCFPTC
jgi:COP9 signalosome complex subunit 1